MRLAALVVLATVVLPAWTPASAETGYDLQFLALPGPSGALVARVRAPAADAFVVTTCGRNSAGGAWGMAALVFEVRPALGANGATESALFPRATAVSLMRTFEGERTSIVVRDGIETHEGPRGDSALNSTRCVSATGRGGSPRDMVVVFIVQNVTERSASILLSHETNPAPTLEVVWQANGTASGIVGGDRFEGPYVQTVERGTREFEDDSTGTMTGGFAAARAARGMYGSFHTPRDDALVGANGAYAVAGPTGILPGCVPRAEACYRVGPGTGSGVPAVVGWKADLFAGPPGDYSFMQGLARGHQYSEGLAAAWADLPWPPGVAVPRA